MEARSFVMGILAWIILGLAAGFVANVILPGDEPGGVRLSLAIGVLGALIGGAMASAFGLGGVSDFFDPQTWLVAGAGAVLLLVNYRAISRQNSG
jgi:uncharacterized membrane protein YeaQ/YmgE (transglycosylase-associated protein family)